MAYRHARAVKVLFPKQYEYPIHSVSTASASRPYRHISFEADDVVIAIVVEAEMLHLAC